jgi:hypothetical protein
MEEHWAVEVASGDFQQFMRKLPEYEQAVVVAAIQHVLAAEAIGTCDREWERPSAVLLCGGYGKGRDSSVKRQQREIVRARPELARWKRSSQS